MEKVLGVWANEPGIQLRLNRLNNSSVIIEFVDTNTTGDGTVLSFVTIAPYRLKRIGQFFLAQ